MALLTKRKNLLPVLARKRSLLPVIGKKKGLSEGNKLFRQSPFNLDGELMNFGFGNRIPSANILETTKNLLDK